MTTRIETYFYHPDSFEELIPSAKELAPGEMAELVTYGTDGKVIKKHRVRDTLAGTVINTLVGDSQKQTTLKVTGSLAIPSDSEKEYIVRWSKPDNN